MKKHNTVKVVLITMLVFLLLSWILPAAYYSGEYVEQGRVQMGLFDLFNYPLTALSYFGYIALFFVLVGGFYGVLYKIPAYRSLLDKIVQNAYRKEKIAISIMIIVMALLVSMCGLNIGIALLVPFIISIILLMGYDKMVAAMVTVGSISAGLIGSTFAYNSLSVMLESFKLQLNYQIGVRLILLAVAVILVIFNVLMYIKNSMNDIKIEKKTIRTYEEEDFDDDEEEIEEKVKTEKVVKAPSKKTTSKKNMSKKTSSSKSNSTKKTTTKSSKSRKSDNKAALKDEDIIVVRESIDDNDDELVPALISEGRHTFAMTLFLSLLFIIFVLAFITWGDHGLKVKFFDDITSGLTKLEVFKFPLFGKLLGTVNSFGNWTITDMFLPMALVALVLVFIYRIRLADAYEGFVKGAKKALLPAAMVILLYSILVLVTYHPFQTVIYKVVLSWTKGFNVATTTLVAILSSLFNSDISYSFQSVIPYYVSVVNKVKDFSLAGIIFQSMYGLTMLVAPTSLILMGTLSYLGISYKEWLKNIWKLLLELFIILLIVFIILALM